MPASAIVALPLALLLWMSGAIGFPLALAAMLALALVVLLTGLLALRAVDAAEMPAPAAWVLGVFVTMLAVYALLEAFNLPAFTAFAIWAARTARWPTCTGAFGVLRLRMQSSQFFMCVSVPSPLERT